MTADNGRAGQPPLESVMTGFITKKQVITNFRELYRLGGLRLIVAVLRAKRGTPFLTVFTATCR